MKRSNFKSKLPPRRPAKQVEYTPKPRATAVARSPARPATAIVSMPKQAYVRDVRFRAMCQGMPCQHCGSTDGVTWAHSNWGMGKGMAIKASDERVAALCRICHAALDHGSKMTKDQRVKLWTAAHARTVLRAVRTGTWPGGVTLPDIEPDVAPARGLRGRQMLDADVLQVLRDGGGEWMSAKVVAGELHMSWWIVSWALSRLVDRLLVEDDVVDVAGRARSVENSKLYRSRPEPGQARPVGGGLPSWLSPQAVVETGEARLVYGRAGLRRADVQSVKAGAPGAPGPDGPEANGDASTNVPSAVTGCSPDDGG